MNWQINIIKSEKINDKLWFWMSKIGFTFKIKEIYIYGKRI